MRDINRIDPFLEELGELWKTHPDLRFGQLVSIINDWLYNKRAHIPMFYIEDDDMLNLLKEIREFYERHNSKIQ